MRAGFCLALVLLACAVQARAEEPAKRPDPDALLAEALYLESGMGDYRGALAIYRDLAEMDDLLPGLAADVLLRAALAHEAIGELAEAEAPLLRLSEAFPDTPQAEVARHRLEARARAEARAASLPANLTFDTDTGGLRKGPGASGRGRIEHELIDDGSGLAGVAAWRTRVVAGKDDAVVLGLDPALPFQGDVRFRVRAGRFPAFLEPRLLLPDGTTFAAEVWEVGPEQGWVVIELSSADFRSAGVVPVPFRQGTGVEGIEIRDTTGLRSTDEGDNPIFLDDLIVR